MDYFGSRHAKDGCKDDIEYGVSRGDVLDVPLWTKALGYMNVKLPDLLRQVIQPLFLPYPKRSDGRKTFS